MIKSIKNLDITNKKVIIRCDFNVPVENKSIIDDTRIEAALPTIKYALDKNAKVILMSHMGRIKEEEDKKNNSLECVAKSLSDKLNKNVIFINETRGKKLEEACKNIKEGEIVLMENTRFEDLNNKKESTLDDELAKYWASLGEVFIDDAFGTAHRENTSNCGIAKYLPSGIGLLMEKEINTLNELNSAEKPFTIILGGKKVSDKIGIIKNLVKRADYILIGGGMAFTFLKAEGFNVGSSIVDNDSLDFCKSIMNKYQDKIIIPVDFRVTKEFKNTGNYKIKDITEFELDDIGMDIGERSITNFNKIIRKSKTIFWNGPLGVYEFDNYKAGTEDLLKYLVDNNIKTILGGGDIVAAASNCNLKDKVFHASTGGGSTLEYLEGKKLPGIESIK